MLEKNLYRILQVDPKASPEVIAAAYRVLARGLHPERDSSGIDEFRLSELRRAFAVLRDPERRHAYDQEIAGETQLVPMGPGLNGKARFAASIAERVQARFTSQNDGRDRIIDFGRYQGWTIRDVGHKDPDYLRWLSRHSSGVRYRRSILQLLAELDAQPVGSHSH